MIRPKKYLGQHFLKDENTAMQIVSSLGKSGYEFVLEIGPGTGALTKFLLQDSGIHLYLAEIDKESIAFLHKTFPQLKDRIFEKDFLKMDLKSSPFENQKIGIIGNFPYNISSQILFKILSNRDKIPEMVGMFQKEVGERIASAPGSRKYGILSVLLQAFYTIEYLFTVNENVFFPPPKVKSSVIRLKRNNVEKLNCDEALFQTIVKTAFNQRRKTLRNALKKIKGDNYIQGDPLLNKRAEQLTVSDFVRLTQHMEKLPAKVGG